VEEDVQFKVQRPHCPLSPPGSFLLECQKRPTRVSKETYYTAHCLHPAASPRRCSPTSPVFAYSSACLRPPSPPPPPLRGRGESGQTSPLPADGPGSHATSPCPSLSSLHVCVVAGGLVRFPGDFGVLDSLLVCFWLKPPTGVSTGTSTSDAHPGSLCSIA